MKKLTILAISISTAITLNTSINSYSMSVNNLNNTYITTNANYSKNSISKNKLITKDIIPDKIAYISTSQLNLDNNWQENRQLLDDYFHRIQPYETLVLDLREVYENSEFFYDYLISKLISNPIKSYTYNFFKTIEELGDILNEYELDEENLSKTENLPKEIASNLPNDICENFKYYFIHEDIIYPNKYSNFHGDIYILIDENITKSAGEFLRFINETGLATTIGNSINEQNNTSKKEPNITSNTTNNFKFYFSNKNIITRDVENASIPYIHYEIDNTLKNTNNILLDKCINKVLELEEINGHSLIEITNKEFNFKNTLPYIIGYDNKNSLEFYELIDTLLSNENGEIKYFGDSAITKEKFLEIYGGYDTICLQYKQPMKLSLQSKSDLIPVDYRDKCHNVTLETEEIEILYERDKHIVAIHLSGIDKGIIIEFYNSQFSDDIFDSFNEITSK